MLLSMLAGKSSKSHGFPRKFDFDCQHHWAHCHGGAQSGGLGKRALPGTHHAISPGQQQQCDPSLCALTSAELNGMEVST